jgi:glucuronate isomerase
MTNTLIPDTADGNRLTASGLDPDRLFPADPATRSRARDLHALVTDLPIISPHGHVDPRLLLDDAPFADPASLFLTHDHYVTRLLHADGADLALFGVGAGGPADPRAAWRAFAERWPLFGGTASGYWLRHEWSTLFGLTDELSAETADLYYDRIAARLRDDDFRPRALFERFRIDVLATTDDPLDDLEVHRALAADPSMTGRVIPTFRPDAYLDPEAPTFLTNLSALAAATGRSVDDPLGYLESLRERRAHFIARGAVSADHGVREPFTVKLDPDEFAALHRDAVAGRLDAQGARLFRGAMLLEMGRMSADDGLVMTIHPGVHRNHSTATFDRFGPDSGHDIPIAVEYTANLRPLLQEVGLRPDVHIVAFSIDETVYSRELAPLAGFYPALYVGAPWWFLDAPDAAMRVRAAVTETAGFSRGSGFIDDTRAFLSIPARHDMARRVDAAFLARLVVEGRIPMTAAERIIGELTVDLPRKVFKL